MKKQYLDAEKASAILQEPGDNKRDNMIDALTEEEAKVLCKFPFEGTPRRKQPSAPRRQPKAVS